MCHFFTLIDDLRQKYFILNQENYISSGDLFTTVKKNRSCILALMHKLAVHNTLEHDSYIVLEKLIDLCEIDTEY